MISLENLDTELAAYSLTFETIAIFGLAFLLALASETVWDVIKGKRKSVGETFVIGFIAVVSALLERTLYGVVFIVDLWLATPFALGTLPQSWWAFPLAILVADFSYYWFHRVEHEVRLFRANHLVHHSSPEFNFTTALRISWVDSLIEWIFFLPMVLIGFSLAQVIEV